MQRIRLSIVSATPLELSSPLRCFLRTIYSTKLRLTPICWSLLKTITIAYARQMPVKLKAQKLVSSLTLYQSKSVGLTEAIRFKSKENLDKSALSVGIQIKISFVVR